MMEGMRCLVWLLLVIGMACGVEDGCAAVVRREVAAAGGGVVPGLGVDLSGRPRVRAMNYYYDEEGNRSLVIVTNSQGAQTRLDHLQWDRQNRLVGYAMFDAGRRCVFEAAYAYDHRARRVYRAERDERNGGGGAWDAAVVTFLGGTSVQEFATTVTPASGGWRYAGYDPYAATGRGGVFSEYGTYVAVAMGGVISPRSAMEGAVVPASAVPRVHIARGVDMGGGVGGLLYTERPGADGLRIHGADARGDVVSQVDRNGEVRWASSYAAYGTRVQEASAGGAPADRFRANSKEEDPTGLLNEGFRYRDLETGTFISRDPLGFVDGPNVYAYVQQNPWSSFDPEGLSAWDVMRGVGNTAVDAVKGASTILQAGQFNPVAMCQVLDAAVHVASRSLATYGAFREEGINPIAAYYGTVAIEASRVTGVMNFIEAGEGVKLDFNSGELQAGFFSGEAELHEHIGEGIANFGMSVAPAGCKGFKSPGKPKFAKTPLTADDVRAAAVRLDEKGFRASDVQAKIDPDHVIKYAEMMQKPPGSPGAFDPAISALDPPTAVGQNQVGGHHRRLAAEITGYPLEVKQIPMTPFEGQRWQDVPLKPGAKSN
jgi:RHS repeat-associated protein